VARDTLRGCSESARSRDSGGSEVQGISRTREALRQRVLIVEAQSGSGDRTAELIDSQPDLATCAVEESILGAIDAVAFHKPDLLLIDPSLPNLEGLGVISSLRAKHPNLKILVVSSCAEELYAESVLQSGAHGYLMKEEISSGLLGAVRAVLLGKISLSYSLSLKFIQRVLRTPADERADAGWGA
jgi:DNA-binding NarL/FixJ family response regulator